MASDDEGESWEALRQSRNRKDKKAGGWQAMGLDYGVFKGIDKKGFRMPTPIQRKTIPCIMDGKDVVGMSRTGSGKTAAFVVPMLHRLKRRDTKGIRAMLISPTRELALQTHKVIKELGRFTGLEAACLVGGDSMDDQFATLHESPDILVATPGRLLHIVVEMNLRLNAVEYIVFDEADRLFEMGFREQLADILKRLPESRQTLLFSATLPKMLVDFAKAGLTDPMLIRLDVDEKVSELLSMIFVTCRPNDRTAAAVHLARKAVNERKQTVMFCATMKHVEYYVAILQKANIDCSFIYSQLDPTARKINISRFRNKETFLLIVTDVAARGVDIPLLDTVINVHFPPKPKLFVHRAGRVARAGQPGTAISLVAADELPYMVDLFLFLGRPMVFAKDKDEHDEKVTMIGRLPDRIVDLESDFLTSIADTDIDLHDLEHKSGMALGKYGRTRPAPSAESARRVKAEVRAAVQACSYHPALREATDRQQTSVLNALANYKSSTTIFEVHSNSKDTQVTVMKNMRRMNAEKIRARQEEEEKKKVAADEEAERAAAAVANQADEATLANAFTELISKSGKKLNRRERMEEEKKLHFISYNAEDARGEAALAVDFSRAAEGASVDIIADDERGLYKQKNEKKWDRKTKRFVGAANDDPSKKKIRTEDGTWIPASYKSGVYEKWVQKRKLGFEKKDGDSDNEGGDDGDDYTDRGVNMDDDSGKPKHHQRRWGKNGGQKGGEERGDGGRKIRNEVLKPEQILKNRKKLLAKQDYQAYRRDENLKKKMNSSGGSRGGKGGRGGGKPIGKAGGGGRISKPGMGGGSKFGAGGRGGFKGGRGGGGRTGGGGGRSGGGGGRGGGGGGKGGGGRGGGGRGGRGRR